MKTRRIGKHRECIATGKVCFNSHEDAERRIKKICSQSNQSGRRWGQYHCSHCGRIHLTSGVKGKPVSVATIRRKLKLSGITT